MTENEWLECTDSYPMLDPLEGKISDRKCYLFSIACLRRIFHLLTDLRCRNLVEVVERWVDDLASNEDHDEASMAFWNPYESDVLEDGVGGYTFEALRNLICYSGAAAAFSVAHAVADAVAYAATRNTPEEDDEIGSSWRTAAAAECREQAKLVHEIIGNPFRSHFLIPDWPTSNVIAFAQVIYEERAFERMSILADALEEAGCDNADILAHCRSGSEHVRGCWVIDLILGKK